MIPGVASATGNINVTAVLALMTLVDGARWPGCGRWASSGSGSGSCRTWTCPAWLKPPLWGLMFVIEVAGPVDPPRRAGRPALRQHVRRARRPGGDPRLHPDGHGARSFWPGDARRASSGVILLSLLELFVAFLQAYIFTFLVGAVHRLGGPSALDVADPTGGRIGRVGLSRAGDDEVERGRSIVDRGRAIVAPPRPAGAVASRRIFLR